MNTPDFNEIAARYERNSLVQRSAAEKLIDLLNFQRHDDVLDLGCGTGNLTRKLRSLTEGTVTGADPSTGMILEAKANQGGHAITFDSHSVDTLPYRDRFSVIFCNSAFQWFRDPERALANCHGALKRDGRMGIQAPATQQYCPNFLKAIDDVRRDPRTSSIFSGFTSPWLFLETADDYAGLFKQAGFDVPFATIEELESMHSPNEAMAIFESGAAAGYLNQMHYSTPIDETYTSVFRDIVRESFRRQADADGKVRLRFNRIYLVAMKKVL